MNRQVFYHSNHASNTLTIAKYGIPPFKHPVIPKPIVMLFESDNASKLFADFCFVEFKITVRNWIIFKVNLDEQELKYFAKGYEFNADNLSDVLMCDDKSIDNIMNRYKLLLEWIRRHNSNERVFFTKDYIPSHLVYPYGKYQILNINPVTDYGYRKGKNY